METSHAAPPPEEFGAPRPQIGTFIGGLVLVWMGAAMMFRSLIFLLLDHGEFTHLQFARLVGNLVVLAVAWVILGSMTEYSLRKLRLALRIGVPVAGAVGLVTAILF